MLLSLDGHVMQVIWAGMHSKGFQRMQFAFKKIQDWSRVDTFKLSYHDKRCPPELTNWAGKAACFGQLMRAKSQTSVGVFKS